MPSRRATTVSAGSPTHSPRMRSSGSPTISTAPGSPQRGQSSAAYPAGWAAAPVGEPVDAHVGPRSGVGQRVEVVAEVEVEADLVAAGPAGAVDVAPG